MLLEIQIILLKPCYLLRIKHLINHGGLILPLIIYMIILTILSNYSPILFQNVFSFARFSLFLTYKLLFDSKVVFVLYLLVVLEPVIQLAHSPALSQTYRHFCAHWVQTNVVKPNLTLDQLLQYLKLLNQSHTDLNVIFPTVKKLERLYHTPFELEHQIDDGHYGGAALVFL